MTSNTVKGGGALGPVMDAENGEAGIVDLT